MELHLYRCREENSIMKYNNYRLAALVIAVMMALSLAACGVDGSGDQPQSGGQVYLPPVNGSTNTPVETGPAVSTNANKWYGLWYLDAFEEEEWGTILEINPNCVYSYRAKLRYVAHEQYQIHLLEPVEIGYSVEEDMICLYFYDENGDVAETANVTIEGDLLYLADYTYKKISNNLGENGNLSGTWYPIGTNVFLGDEEASFDGQCLTFYRDGSVKAEWTNIWIDDPWDTSKYDDCGGTYYFTSKFDIPAIAIHANGYDIGTFGYEFLTNDLIMLYTDDEYYQGFLMYRKS